MLPGMSGLDLCRELRARCAVPIIMVTALGEEADRVVGLETGADDYLAKPFSSRELVARLRARCAVPILILTALGEEADRVIGLETGADDYLAKPFSSRELLARLRALVRRGRGTLGPPREVIRVGELELSARDYSASLAGRPLRLTTSEFVLLRVLAERAGRVLSREQLLDLTKGSADEAFDRSIDAHVSRLRAKLGDDPKQPRLLRTVRGAGYVLAVGGGDAL